jgi:nucleoside-diphosphate-sugar epimerase
MVEQKLEEKANLDYQPAHAADVPATWADISKAKDLLKWQPQTSLDQGIQNLVDWYQKNETWAREIKTS